MVSTRKRMEGVGHKKSDGKGKRVRDDDYRKDLKTFVEGKDSMAKSSKQGKLLMVKSEVEDKKLGRHTNKKAKSLLCIDSDFEGSAKKEGKEDAVEAHKRKIVPRQKQLKIWELFYEEHHRNFYAKVIYWCEMEVPNIIKNKLSVVQLDKFKLTCFGKFLDFGQPQMFSQIIHHALIREVYQRDSGEMWFIFGERRVRFGLPEFCLISGLNWQGDEDIGSFKGIENLLVEKFFQNEVLTRSSIGRIYRSACFDDDDEAVRMSIIFLVFNFILATVSDNYVDEALFNFLSYGDVASYPWGKVAFEQTKNSLSLAVKGHVKKDKYGGVIYNFYSDSYCKSYKLSGLPYVFQVFLFETIPTLKVRGFCIDDNDNDSEFRLFRWRELGKAPKNEKLNDLVFDSGQLIIQNLVPTEDEKLRLDLGGFYFFSGSDSGAKRSDIKVESSRKVKDLMFSISDVEKIIDERVKPLEGKVIEVKKEIENLGVEFKDQLQGFRIQICRDIKKMFRKQLYGKSSYLKRRNVTVIDDGDGDDDDDDDDVIMKVDDVNVVVDDVMKVVDDVVIEVGDISKQFHGSNTADVGGVGVIKFEEVDAKIENKNDNLNSYGKEIVVYTPRRVLINVENEKVEKINEIPRFDILSQCSGQEIGVFTPIEGSKSEAPDRSMLDDMVLTTQDLLHCVEVEKSATNPLELLVIGLARRMALPGAHRDGRELRIHESLDELSTDLAEYIAELSEVSVKERGAFAIALSGGSLISFMGKLCQAPYNKTVDWAKWHIFWADERVVAKNHVDSNYKLAKDTLLSKVPIVPSHVHSINDSLSAEEAADDYEFVIRQLVRTRVVGVSDISDCPMFDLMLLGMGSDGHVASLFPNHSVLDEKDKWVTFIIDSPKPPPERITFSLSVINSSANVALVVTGSSKAQVVHLAIDDVGSECPSLPAKMIQPTKGKLVWFLDKPAASKLDDGAQFSG